LGFFFSENRVAELNRALASKVSQALQTAMQLEEAKAEVAAFEKAMSDASAAVPDGQVCSDETVFNHLFLFIYF
jgi:predicted carbohydrate-binding protein with CBM5 and CBM33 domain